MRQLLILPTLMFLISCGNQNKVRMSEKTQENVGVIVLVTTKTKESYKQNEVVNLSKKIDPMVDEFKGYLGRKMAFSHQDPSFLVDVVYYTDEKAATEAAEKEMKSETCNRFFECMNFETLKQFNFSPVIITNPLKGKVNAIELVLFKKKDEYTNEQVIQAANGMNAVMENYDGYVSRKLAVTEDGQWMDLVYWIDLENAKKASKNILENKLGETYFKMIDDTTMDFIHLDVVIDTER